MYIIIYIIPQPVRPAGLILFWATDICTLCSAIYCCMWACCMRLHEEYFGHWYFGHPDESTHACMQYMCVCMYAWKFVFVWVVSKWVRARGRDCSCKCSCILHYLCCLLSLLYALTRTKYISQCVIYRNHAKTEEQYKHKISKSHEVFREEVYIFLFWHLFPKLLSPSTRKFAAFFFK